MFPLYAMRWQFRPVIKMMANAENILNEDEFFAYAVDTPKEVVEQHRKLECLKSATSKGKVYLLEGKKQWAQDKIDGASDEAINKLYAKYKQQELNKQGGKMGKLLGKHAIGIYFTGISQVVKIRDVIELQQVSF